MLGTHLKIPSKRMFSVDYKEVQVSLVRVLNLFFWFWR